MPLIVAPESNRVVLGYKEPNYDEEGWYVVEDEDLALMIVAPELLEALEAMLGCYEGVYDMAVPTRHQSDEAKRAEGLARSALAKARGES